MEKDTKSKCLWWNRFLNGHIDLEQEFKIISFRNKIKLRGITLYEINFSNITLKNVPLETKGFIATANLTFKSLINLVLPAANWNSHHLLKATEFTETHWISAENKSTHQHNAVPSKFSTINSV